MRKEISIDMLYENADICIPSQKIKIDKMPNECLQESFII